MCFAIFTTLSVLQALLSVKYFTLINLAEGGIENFITMAFFIMNACTKVYYIYLHVRREKNVTRMLVSTRKLRDFSKRHSTARNEWQSSSSVTFATALGITSIMVPLIQAIFSDWTLKGTILLFSKVMRIHMYAWKPEVFDDDSDDGILRTIVERFQNDLTTPNILVGVFGIMLNISSAAQINVAGDLMLVTARTIKEEMTVFVERIYSQNNNYDNITLTEFLSEDGPWVHFQLLKRGVNDSNDAFDSLLKYMHINNMMRFVYFVMNAFDGEFSLFQFISLVYNIVKTSCTYRSATKAANLV